MLSFLLEQICIGIDNFLLNYIAAFGSVLGLQVTVGPQVNSGLQPPTRWEPFVAGTMLRRPEPTKEIVEPMILSNNSNWDCTSDQVHSSIAATNSTLYVA